MHGAQQERAQLARPAELQELARVRQRADRVLHLPEPAVKPVLQLRQRDVRHVLVVEDRERQAKLGAELLQGHLRPLGLRQHVIGRLPDRGQIVHQRARPVEDDVPNHGRECSRLSRSGNPTLQSAQRISAPARGLRTLELRTSGLRPALAISAGLPLEFIPQLPPEPPWVFRPQQHPEPGLPAFGPDRHSYSIPPNHVSRFRNSSQNAVSSQV